MNWKNNLLIPESEGYSKGISHLVAQMKYVRKKTVDSVLNLSIEQLDFRAMTPRNSIGGLLKHLAANERLYQVRYFEDRIFTNSEFEFWNGSLQSASGLSTVSCKGVEYYLELLGSIRDGTFFNLKTKDDAWLTTVNVFHDVQLKENNYFRMFHLIEDEINHAGQIKLIKKQFI